MLHRKGAATLAACVALACTGIVRAGSTAPGSEDGRCCADISSRRYDCTIDGTGDCASATPPKPLMAGLDAIGIGKPLEDANITIGGYIDGGYTILAEGDNRHTLLTGRVFDTKNNFPCSTRRTSTSIVRWITARLPPITRSISAAISRSSHGWDAGLIHSSGLFDNPATLGVTHGQYRSRTSPENQFDVEQAYVDFALPVGTGLRIRAGKFVTLLGYEVIIRRETRYSHSYMFGFAIPFTNTGVMGEYKLGDDWVIDGGITPAGIKARRTTTVTPISSVALPLL